ncbi:hypothetical protein VNI00_002877 [Paramarasmius palmivorus]|uniref:F-box domain-containing protein n=1 Tax=Paramarasmius palmivorus TaxID=297713 RepID=A0AAW0DV19_9AGAR
MERSVLLHEETRLVAELSRIRTKLNALTSIAVLPPEVLLQIMTICAQRTHPCTRRGHRNVLAFSQVCRQWRILALQTSSLWSTIDLCNVAYASAYLTRSKDAPISLEAVSPLKAYNEPLEQHKRRIRSIDAILFPDCMLALFRSIDTADIIVLKNLTELNLRIPSIAAHVDLSCLQIPAVRRLTLEGVKVDWESCQGLMSLRLCGLVATHAPTYRELLGMLGRSPLVEEIHLEDVVPGDADYRCQSKIPLLHLNKVAVMSKQADCVPILQEALLIPSTAQVKLRSSGAARWMTSSPGIFFSAHPASSPDALHHHVYSTAIVF